MKIIFEPGDIVEVEDNIDAGDASGTTVKLLYPLSPESKVWVVEILSRRVDGGGPEPGTRENCDELFFYSDRY